MLYVRCRTYSEKAGIANQLVDQYKQSISTVVESLAPASVQNPSHLFVMEAQDVHRLMLSAGRPQK